jgi:hypothetical protein
MSVNVKDIVNGLDEQFPYINENPAQHKWV